MEDKEKLWTKDFVLVIIINFLVFLNHLMILSTFPFFIERLGYSDTVSGACATAFSLVAVLARPFVGWLLDTGRRRVLLGVGLIGMALMPMGYLVIYTALASLALAILLRMVHGLSLACANTSTSTMATDILPRSRFSEGMGMFGMATALATACAPAIGEALMKRGFGALSGYAFGGIEPALQSMAVHTAAPDRRGAANSTFLCAYDIGIGLGGGLAGLLIDRVGYGSMFGVIAVANVLSVAVYVLWGRRHASSMTRAICAGEKK